MDLPKKISSIDQKSSSTSKKMQKSSSTTMKVPSQPPKTRVTAGESLKHAVDLYFKTYDLHTPMVSQAKIRTNNLTKKTSIPKSQSKEKPEIRTRLHSASSKSLRKSDDAVAVECQRSSVPQNRLHSASSKSLKKTEEKGNIQPIDATSQSSIEKVESHQSNVTEIGSIAEENELVIDLTALINEELVTYNPFEPNLPVPRSMGSFLNFIGPPHPENNAEAAVENLVTPPNSSVSSSNDRINTATQMDPSTEQQSQPSVYEDAISKSYSQGLSADDLKNIQTNGAVYQLTNVNNSFSTADSMETCGSSFTHNSSNKTVARECYADNNKAPYVVPMVVQQPVYAMFIYLSVI